MRKIMMAVAALALSSGVAWGQGTATQNVSLTATVGGYCTIDNSSIGTAITRSITVTNGKASGTGLGLISITGVTCTAQPKIRLQSTKGGIVAGAGSPAITGNFVNKIHYTATATYASVQSIINTQGINNFDGGSSSLSSTGIQTGGTLTLQVSPVATPDTNLLVNGDYDDTLTITLGPNV